MTNGLGIRPKVFIAGFLATVSWPAFAQAGPAAPDAVAPPKAPTTKATDGTDIVVTALRRDERQVNVPATITIVSGDLLQNAGISKFQDLGNVAAGIQISRSGAFTQPAIRGVSTTFAAAGQEANVGVYIDGFYQSDLISISQDFANLENVQVLKGPQAVLYGRNATGGAILITTKSPSNTIEGDASISYARYSDLIAKAYFSVPLIADKLAISLGGYFRKSDGYIRDINNFAPNVPNLLPGIRDGIGRGDHEDASRQRSLRAKAKLTPVKSVSLTFGYNYGYLNEPRAYAYNFIGQSPLAAFVPILTPGNEQSSRRDTTSLNFHPVGLSVANEYTLLGEFDLGDAGVITTHSSYFRKRETQIFDFDGTPVSAFEGIQRNRRRTFTQALDYDVQISDRISILAGGFFYRDRFRNSGLSAFSLPAGLQKSTTKLQFNTLSYSFYIDGTLRLGDSIYVTAGGRYNYDRKRVMRGDVDSLNGSQPPEVVLSNRASYRKFTPHGVIRYEITSDSNVYASISTGFKSGTINSSTPLNAVDPETVTAYEVGYKTRQNATYFEISAFYYDYKDNQISSVPATLGNTVTLVQNAGGSRIYGLDAQVTSRIARDFNVRAAISYLHARYTDFENAANTTISPGGTNTTVVGDWTGRRLVRAPDFSGNVGADYSLDLAGGRLMIAGTVSFSSRYATQNASYLCAYVTTPQNICTMSGGKGRFEENGWVLLSGQVQWTEPSEHYTLALFAENVTNERYKIISTGSNYGSYDVYNQPRSIGARVGVKF